MLAERVLVEDEPITSHEELLRETRNYIADIVWRSLCANSPATDHLCFIEETCKRGYVASISTLCHDTHVENYLTNGGIPLADGFSAPEAGVRYWNVDLSGCGKVLFLKLHGPVNWFRLSPDNSESFHDEKIGISLDGDYNHTRTRDGTLQTALDGRPMLLIGTFNKISEYSGGIFRDLHSRFRSSIGEVDGLVVCGYSFGDKGINSEIIDWYYDKRGRRLLVIHPNPEELRASSRGAISRNWGTWEKQKAITCISKKIEDVLKWI